jgi:hypothetical protein
MELHDMQSFLQPAGTRRMLLCSHLLRTQTHTRERSLAVLKVEEPAPFTERRLGGKKSVPCSVCPMIWRTRRVEISRVFRLGFG